MSHFNVIIVHGAYGYPDENWFGWLKAQLDESGISCFIPRLPTPQGQSLKAWLNIFDLNCKSLIHPNTILIGHSLGAILILRWLELHSVQLHSVILVGAFLNKVGIKKFDSINRDFFETPFSWQAIRPRVGHFICYQGTHDPYVKYTDFKYISKKLGARRMVISHGAHLNAHAGYIQFPHLLFHLKQKMEL